MNFAFTLFSFLLHMFSSQLPCTLLMFPSHAFASCFTCSFLMPSVFSPHVNHENYQYIYTQHRVLVTTLTNNASWRQSSSKVKDKLSKWQSLGCIKYSLRLQSMFQSSPVEIVSSQLSFFRSSIKEQTKGKWST